jgi:hypothetical protein
MRKGIGFKPCCRGSSPAATTANMIARTKCMFQALLSWIIACGNLSGGAGFFLGGVTVHGPRATSAQKGRAER